jgi:predicted Zn-dependent peptidase
MDEDLPDDRVHTLLAETLFGDHPLGRETAGSEATVSAMTHEQVVAHVNQWYRPNSMVLAMAGDLDHETVCEAAEAQFVQPEADIERQRTTPTMTMGERRELTKDVEQTHIALAVPGLPREHPDREVLDVLSHVLGGGPASRLFDEIREQRGLAYSVYSSVVSYADIGALLVSVGTSPKHAADVEKVIADQFAAFVAEPITDEELDVAIGFLTGVDILGLEDTGARAGRLGAQLTLRNQLIDVDAQIERYRAITAADVHRVASACLGASPTVAVVGPSTRRSRAHS